MTDSQKYLCIHGHFYQPPREDPWLGFVPPEGSAGPEHDWNERIARESYAPLSRARVLGENGRISEIVNCYEYMSFNFGPTLMHWMQRGDPDTYARIIEGDRLSAERTGHGNAMAQIQHHVIMPLASERDKKVETAWAIADFQGRFKRDPQGMWLSEAAADLPTLDVLAKAGIRFTVLAPGQAEAVTDESGRWRNIHEHELDISLPYEVELPSGRSIAVFFYNGGISQAVAFERLLASGETFLSRLAGASHPGLLSLATDGETYGHHFTFGEMALAYVLTQIRDNGQVNGGLKLTNFARFLAENPPRFKARIKEPSSWSCAHGVDRWRSDCGCTTGGEPGWTQAWRAPLRAALENCRDAVDKHFFSAGADLFKDPEAALLDYGKVIVNSENKKKFVSKHFSSKSNAVAQWKLLTMQRNSLASMASCSWFFEDLDRLEAVNAMRYALRAMELMAETGGPELLDVFAENVGIARSNRREALTGRDLFTNHVLPARETPVSIIAQAVAARSGTLKAGDKIKAEWPYVVAEISIDSARFRLIGGTAVIRRLLTGEEQSWQWSAEHEVGDLLTARYKAAVLEDNSGLSGIPAFETGSLTWRKRQALAVASAERLEAEAWDYGLTVAENLIRAFQPLGVSQESQNRAWVWGRFRAPLTYLFVLGRAEGTPGREALKSFLAGIGPCEPEKEAARRRVEEKLSAYLNNEPPGLEIALEMLQRSGEIGLDLDLWKVQNLIWDGMRGREDAADLVHALNFQA